MRTCSCNADRLAIRPIAKSLCVLAICGLVVAVCNAHERTDPPSSSGQKRPAIIAKHCLECHSGDEPKSELALDRLAVDFADRRVEEQWLTVLKRVQSGEDAARQATTAGGRRCPGFGGVD